MRVASNVPPRTISRALRLETSPISLTSRLNSRRKIATRIRDEQTACTSIGKHLRLFVFLSWSCCRKCAKDSRRMRSRVSAILASAPLGESGMPCNPAAAAIPGMIKAAGRGRCPLVKGQNRVLALSCTASGKYFPGGIFPSSLWDGRFCQSPAHRAGLLDQGRVLFYKRDCGLTLDQTGGGLRAFPSCRGRLMTFSSPCTVDRAAGCFRHGARSVRYPG